jgi:transmembrane sensor
MDEIIERARRGEASEDERRRLAAWRRASRENEQRFWQTTRLLGAAESLAPASADVPTAVELLARPRAVARPPARRVPAWVPWTIAAAAVIALVVVQRQQSSTGQWALGDVVTGATEMATIRLGDGSIVRLAPASRLRVAGTSAPSRREVDLDGRAYFVIAKHAGRPFVVHTRSGDATVLGTRFELAARDSNLHLVVVEGRVALSAGAETVEVEGGEESGVRDRRPVEPKKVAAADQLDAWVGKFLAFQSTPVRDAAREIERMYGIHIRPDSTIASRTISAIFTDRTAAQVLEVLCSVTDAACQSLADTTVMTAKP